MRILKLVCLAAVAALGGCAGPRYSKDAYLQGKTDAHHALAAGHLVVETYGLPPTHFEEYTRLMRERYAIEIRPIAGCCVTDTILGHSRGFNVVMEAEVEKRFGRNVCRQTVVEAERLHRARVLEAIANEK